MYSTLTVTVHGLGTMLNYYNCKMNLHRRNFLVIMLHACVRCVSTVRTWSFG